MHHDHNGILTNGVIGVRLMEKVRRSLDACLVTSYFIYFGKSVLLYICLSDQFIVVVTNIFSIFYSPRHFTKNICYSVIHHCNMMNQPPPVVSGNMIMLH